MENLETVPNFSIAGDPFRHTPTEDKSFGELFSKSRSIDAIGPSIYEAVTEESLPEQTQTWFPSEDEVGSLTRDDNGQELPQEYKERILRETTPERAERKRSQILKGLEVERELAQHGWEGFSARIAATLLDETAIGVGLLTGGLGAGAKLQSVPRLYRAFRFAGLSAAEAGLLEAVTLHNRPTKSMNDVLWTMATAGAISAPFGFIGKTKVPEVDTRYTDVLQKVADEVDQDLAYRALRNAPDEALTAVERRARQAELEALTKERHATDGELAKLRESRQKVDEIDPMSRLVDELDPEGTKRPSGAKAPEDAAFALMLKKVGGKRRKGKTTPSLQAKARIGVDEEVSRLRKLIGQEAQDLDGQIKAVESRVSELDAKAASLQKLIDNPPAPSRGPTVRAPEGDSPEVVPHGDESVGAASTGGPQEIALHDDGDIDELLAYAKAGETKQQLDAENTLKARAIRALRFSLYGALDRSKSQSARLLNKLMFSDGVGPYKGSGKAATVSAAEESDILSRLWATKFLRVEDEAWHRYSSRIKDRSAAARQKFNELAWRHIEMGDQTDPDIVALAKSVGDNNKEILELAKKHLQGFEDVTERDLWINRKWASHRLQYFNSTESGVGGNRVMELLEKSVVIRREGAEDLSESEILMKRGMAKAIFHRMLGKAYGLDHEFHQALFTRDIAKLREILDGTDGLSKAERDAIIEGLQDADVKKDQSKASIGHARRRIELDMSASIEVEGFGRLGISDLLEKDLRKLHLDYSRKMAGQMAVAKSLQRAGLEGPVHVPSALESFKKRIREELGSEGQTRQQIDATLKKFDMGTRAVLGLPPTDQHYEKWAEYLRFLNKWNYTRLMGQVGFAQIAELGPVMGQVGMGTLFRNIPELRRMFKRGADGKVNHALMREIEDTLGAYGAERMLHQPHYMFDDFGIDTGSKLQKASYHADRLGKLVSDVSGMNVITNSLQKVVAVDISRKFLKMASGATKPKNMERLRSVGLSDEMLDRVIAQIQRIPKSQRTVTTDGGRKVELLGLEKWTDYEAREALGAAMHKWAYRVVQRNMVGETPSWMMSPLGATAFQFRSFVFGAWEKQLLVNINQWDMQTLGTFMGSMLFAGLAYTAQTTLNSVGRDDQDDYLEEMLSPKRLATAAFQRAGFASIIPGVVDTTLTHTPFLDEPIFAYRSSGLASDFITGNPTISLLNDLASLVKDVPSATFRSDYDFTRGDLDALFGLAPLGNAMGMRNLENWLASESDLPHRNYRDPLTIEDYFE